MCCATKRRRRTTESRRGRVQDKTPRDALRYRSLSHSKLHWELSSSTRMQARGCTAISQQGELSGCDVGRTLPFCIRFLLWRRGCEKDVSEIASRITIRDYIGFSVFAYYPLTPSKSRFRTNPKFSTSDPRNMAFYIGAVAVSSEFSTCLGCI